MHQILILFVLLVLSFLGSALLCGFVRRALLKGAVLDHPNERSLHEAPVPRGGGIGIWLAVLPLWIALCAWKKILPLEYPIFLGLALLIGISWWDDRKAKPALLR
ncbi:MAG TPA: hypothetical protein VHB73_07820, partial [Alphaproteobacteria bacterium]|nr:hypothetical protein [Alphaproteobacteria bacterium]